MKAMKRAILLGLPLVLLSGPALAGPLKLDIRNGRVTLEARDVPVRDILAEWARLGQTRIENREQVGGAPVTLTLIDVPEREALDVLLRAVSGYIAAPRAVPVQDASMYELIFVLAAARPASSQGSGTAQTSAQQQLFRGGRGQVVAPGMARPPGNAADEGTEGAVPPVMRPGVVMDGVPVDLEAIRAGQLDALRSTIQIQMSPGGQMMQTAPVIQTSQPPPYTSTPGMPTAVPGTPVPGMPTGMPPGVTTVPGAPPAAPKPIKPPGGQ